MKAANSSQSPDFLLNNLPVSVRGVDPQTTLLDYIRAQGLTGAKEGCAEGECGACTVVLVANREGGSEYRAVNSCLMLAPMAAGHEIYTVEALAAGDRLDGIGDHLARDERVFHPLGAHGDAVGDGDGVEDERLAAGLRDALG